MMKNTTFTGSSLEEALKNGSFTQSGIELVGMVKASEKKGNVCFTRSGCDNWVDLPIDMIEEAEQIGKNICKDHSHPVMRITLKEPKNQEAKIFAALSSNSTPLRIDPSLSKTEPSFMAPQPYRVQQGEEPRYFPTPPSETSMRSRRFGSIGRGFGFGGGGNFFDPSFPCCCSYTGTVCSGGYCWPATYQVCISCPGGTCECSSTGPYCGPNPTI